MNTASMSAKTGSDVLVIGGGAAGMMAALHAARGGATVALLERNEKLGKKIYITGKGRGNVTNTAEGEAFLAQVPRNPKFLYSALRAFDNHDLIELLARYGTRTKVERGGRVFPESEHASDITRALTRALQEAGVQIHLNARVTGVRAGEQGIEVCLTDGATLRAPACVIATGGLSYPATGSTGDGYAFAKANGHSVTPLRGALVGLVSDADWPKALQGLALKNVRLCARGGKKVIYDELGEILFTHFGFSGPLIIELSSHLPEDVREAMISLDLKPGLTTDMLDQRLQRELAESPRRLVGTMLQTLLPARFAPVFATLAGLSPDQPCASVGRLERFALLTALKALPLPAHGLRPVEEAIVTRGGVSVREIAPGTMMSRLHPGLFFAGEVLDLDAHTGGFNLQIAFSTAALAGASAAAYAISQEVNA